MAFWSDGTGQDPKRKFRWLFAFGGGTGGEALPAYIIKKVTKPTFTVSEVKHSFINHSFYYPGRVEYNEIEFTLVDPVDPDAAQLLRQIITASGYELPNVMDTAAPQTMTKAKAIEALGTVAIRQIDGEGTVIEEWKLASPWIKEVNYGDLDYESDDIGEIVVKMRYDWAEFSQVAT